MTYFDTFGTVAQIRKNGMLGTGSEPVRTRKRQIAPSSGGPDLTRWQREAPWMRQIAPDLSGSVNWFAPGPQLEANRRRQIAPSSGGPDLTRLRAGRTTKHLGAPPVRQA